MKHKHFSLCGQRALNNVIFDCCMHFGEQLCWISCCSLGGPVTSSSPSLVAKGLKGGDQILWPARVSQWSPLVTVGTNHPKKTLKCKPHTKANAQGSPEVIMMHAEE